MKHSTLHILMHILMHYCHLILIILIISILFKPLITCKNSKINLIVQTMARIREPNNKLPKLVVNPRQKLLSILLLNGYPI